MTPLHAATSDWHVFNAGVRDRCQRYLVDRTFDVCVECGVTHLWVLMDMFERMKGSVRSIQREDKNVTWLRANAWKANDNGIHLHLVGGGNHDPKGAEEFAPWLRDVCQFDRVIVHGPVITPVGEGPDQCGVWTMLHGHQLDDVCGSWFSPVARGITWFVGNSIERIVPSFPESPMNPVDWFAPRARRESRAGTVGLLLRDYARDSGLHLLAGHTHKHDIQGGINDKGQEWSYVNVGACSDNAPFSIALFTEEGQAQLITDSPRT